MQAWSGIVCPGCAFASKWDVSVIDGHCRQEREFFISDTYLLPEVPVVPVYKIDYRHDVFVHH